MAQGVPAVTSPPREEVTARPIPPVVSPPTPDER